jgi:superfamily II DNA or RNA helicase
VGDGQSAVDPDAQVVVATHAHLTAGTLEGGDAKWSVVFVDEAHHCIGNQTRAKLDALTAKRFLELSATFPQTETVNFKVSMREAIDEGVVADYRVQLLEISMEGDKDALMLDLFKKRYGAWGATLAVFNDLERGGQFAERLCAAGITAELVSGATPAAVRKAVAARLESGDTRVAVCVKCWNEGVDVPCLSTVVFCDARDSDVNKRQLAQRASRRHHAKPLPRRARGPRRARRRPGPPEKLHGRRPPASARAPEAASAAAEGQTRASRWSTPQTTRSSSATRS